MHCILMHCTYQEPALPRGTPGYSCSMQLQWTFTANISFACALVSAAAVHRGRPGETLHARSRSAVPHGTVSPTAVELLLGNSAWDATQSLFSLSSWPFRSGPRNSVTRETLSFTLHHTAAELQAHTSKQARATDKAATKTTAQVRGWARTVACCIQQTHPS